MLEFLRKGVYPIYIVLFYIFIFLLGFILVISPPPDPEKRLEYTNTVWGTIGIISIIPIVILTTYVIYVEINKFIKNIGKQNVYKSYENLLKPKIRKLPPLKFHTPGRIDQLNVLPQIK